MKFALMAGIALAFTGVAQAGDLIISDTVAGTISSASDFNQLSEPVGNFDGTGLFGGVNLFGQSLTMTFTYDVTQMETDGGFYFDDSEGHSGLIDYNGHTTLTISVTIAGYTFSLPANYQSVEAYGAPEYPYDKFSLSDQSNSGASITAYGLNFDQPQLYDVANPLTPAQIFGGPHTAAEIDITAADGAYDDVSISSTRTPSATPEPTTWLLLAMGLGGVVLLKLTCASPCSR
jgi:flagellin-like hook-associated protein FlgL